MIEIIVYTLLILIVIVFGIPVITYLTTKCFFDAKHLSKIEFHKKFMKLNTGGNDEEKDVYERKG